MKRDSLLTHVSKRWLSFLQALNNAAQYFLHLLYGLLSADDVEVGV